MSAGPSVASKYNLKTDMNCPKAFFCTPCYASQIMNEVMKREKLAYGTTSLKEAGAPPGAEMER